MLTELPIDMIHEIFRYFDKKKDIASLGLTCKYFYSIFERIKNGWDYVITNATIVTNEEYSFNKLISRALIHYKKKNCDKNTIFYYIDFIEDFDERMSVQIYFLKTEKKFVIPRRYLDNTSLLHLYRYDQVAIERDPNELFHFDKETGNVLIKKSRYWFGKMEPRVEYNGMKIPLLYVGEEEKANNAFEIIEEDY